MPQAVNNITVLHSFGERKVTIYAGTKKHEATEVTLRRKPDRLYRDTIQCEFKPKRARRMRYFVDNHDRLTVVLDGWGHP